MACELCATCGSGDASANECAYGDAAGITRSDCDARTHVHRNTHTNANCDCCATHGDAQRDVHSDT